MCVCVGEVELCVERRKRGDGFGGEGCVAGIDVAVEFVVVTCRLLLLLLVVVCAFVLWLFWLKSSF